MWWSELCKILARSLSTIGAIIMAQHLYFTIQNKRNSHRILFALAISDFIFSMVGIVQSSLNLADTDDTITSNIWYILFILITHWSFEIASFLWTWALAWYIILSTYRKQFYLILTHILIWLITCIYFMMEILALIYKNDGFLYLVRISWDIIALGAVMNIIFALFIITKRPINSSFIISRLNLYVIAFILFVTPSIIHDILFYIHGNHSEEKDYFGEIASISFALLPLVNSLIYTINTRWFFCFTSSFFNSTRSSSLELESKELTTSRLKNLEINVKIGQGMMSVYLGKWRGIEVAIKMQTFTSDDIHLKHNDSFTRLCNKEIQKEAKIMKSLRHPNIVLFMDAGLYDGSLVLISEYCSNGSLRDVLNTNPNLVWSMKIRLALGIVHGLQYLHSSSMPMIHRDLKSPNILVDASWHAKIGDFGTLRFAEIIHQHHAIKYSSSSTCNNNNNNNTQEANPEKHNTLTGKIGTIRWMAPEILRNEGNYNEKVDIFSLGMILYEFINGNYPFHEIKWNYQIEEMILSNQRPSIDVNECPVKWKELIEQCWKDDPNERPSCDKIIHQLESIAQEEIWEEFKEDGIRIKLSTQLQHIDCEYILRNTLCELDRSSLTCTPYLDADYYHCIVSLKQPHENQNQ